MRFFSVLCVYPCFFILQQACIFWPPKALGCVHPCPNLARLNVGMWGLKLGSLGRTLSLVPLALWTVEPCCLRDKYSDSLSIPRRGC